MALSIVVNGGGTFSASMEEGPVSFTASLGAVPGPQGPAGATGPTGVIAATAPIQYDSGTQTVSIDPAYKPNPFNQSLNTTSNVVFNQIVAGSQPPASAPIGAILNINGIGLTGGTQIVFGDATAQTTAFKNDWSGSYQFSDISAGAPGAGNYIYITGSQIQFPDLTQQTTAFIGEARKEYLIARNNTGSTIGAGKVVYLTGANGTHPTIALAQANSESTSARTIGVTAEAISNNADGKVIISGAVEQIDTSAFTAGQTVYLSSSVAGGLQTTLPAAPLHGVVVGIVTRANANNGSIEVFIQNYQELSELSDVSVADKANNDGLFWETSSSTWRSKTIAEVLGYTPADNASLASYAPLASPTFTGNPIAPTPATSDNDTSIATTAFVNAYCPTASTTTAGKVELATDAEAIAGTSTTLAVTPSGLESGLTAQNFIKFFIPLWTGSTSGIGAAGTTVQGNQRVFAPDSAVGYGIRGHIASFLVRGGNHETANINFSKRIRWAFRAARYRSPTDTNTVARILLGKNASAIAGDPVVKAIGIRMIASNVVQLLAHDGTTLRSFNTSFTPSGLQSFDCVITSDGAGNVSLFINGNLEASTNQGPTGLGATSFDHRVEAENLATITGLSIGAYYSNHTIEIEP